MCGAKGPLRESLPNSSAPRTRGMLSSRRTCALGHSAAADAPAARSRAAIAWLLASCLGACAVGADATNMGADAGLDAAPTADGAARADAADGAERPADAETSDGEVDEGGSTENDAAEPDADLSDAGIDASDAGTDAEIDANPGMPDAGDAAVVVDSGGPTQPDGSTTGDSGGPEGGQAPVDCRPIVRSGVQLCDMTHDTCGAVFTNSLGCTAVCAAAGLACASAYENVENQCARDETRPALACDSGHQSDYCLCRRP